VLLLEQTDNENQNEERRREKFGVKERNLKPNHQLGVERKKKTEDLKLPGYIMELHCFLSWRNLIPM